MRIWRGRGILRASIALAGTLAVTSCAVTPPVADPLADAGGGSSPRGSIRSQRADLLVVCGFCAINYSIAGVSETVPIAGPTWRHSVVRYPAFPEAIRLTASGGESIDARRIYVNNTLAASSKDDQGNSTVFIGAVIPLSPAPADTSRSEGRPGR